MRLSISTIIRTCFRLIRQDPIILVPFIIFAMVVDLSELGLQHLHKPEAFQLVDYLIRFVGFSWFGMLIVQTWTIHMSLALPIDGHVNIPQSFSATFKSLWRAFAASIPFAGPFSFLIIFLLTELHIPVTNTGSATQISPTPMHLCIMVILVICSILMTFVPIGTIQNGNSVTQNIVHLPRLLAQNWVYTILFMGLMISYGVVILTLSVLASPIPIIGETLIPAVLSGAGQALMTLSYSLLYHQFTQPIHAIDLEI